MARGRVETFTGYFPALRYVKITCSLLRVSELQQLFLPSLLPRRVYQSHGYTRVSNLQAASACTQPFGGRCVERCIIRHSRTIRGWYAQTYTGSIANGLGTNFRWCGRVGLAGTLLGQAPEAKLRQHAVICEFSFVYVKRTAEAFFSCSCRPCIVFTPRKRG